MKKVFIVFGILIIAIGSCKSNLYIRKKGDTRGIKREFVELKNIQARCCSAPCWPDGILGYRCNLKFIKQKLFEKAYGIGADGILDLSCRKTKDRCNFLCESKGGYYLMCTGQAIKWK